MICDNPELNAADVESPGLSNSIGIFLDSQVVSEIVIVSVVASVAVTVSLKNSSIHA